MDSFKSHVHTFYITCYNFLCHHIEHFLLCSFLQKYMVIIELMTDKRSGSFLVGLEVFEYLWDLQIQPRFACLNFFISFFCRFDSTVSFDVGHFGLLHAYLNSRSNMLTSWISSLSMTRAEINLKLNLAINKNTICITYLNFDEMLCKSMECKYNRAWENMTTYPWLTITSNIGDRNWWHFSEFSAPAGPFTGFRIV